MTQTDRDLLAAYLAGSHDAFRALADRYAALVYATARRQADPQLAEDIAQAVFILLARRAHTLRDPALLPAWLLKVTRYCAAEARRSAARRRKHEHKAAAMATSFTTDPSPDPLAQHLDAALASLSAADRTAILLRFYNNQSLAEVALSLNTTEEAAKKRVARALEKLRKIFRRQNITLSAALIAGTFANHATAAPPALAAKIAAAALAKSTATSAAALIAKGALKLMTYTTAKWTAAAAVGVLVVAAGTTAIVHPHKTSQFIAAPPPAAPSLPITASVISSPSIRILPHDPVPTIEVTDLATHAPISGATVEITVQNSDGLPIFHAPPATGLTGPDGTVQLPYPPTTANDINLRVSKHGYVPAENYSIRRFPTDRAPAHFSFTLEKAITIGGRVLDPHENPLPNATVLVTFYKPYPNGTIATEDMLATTDSQGNWSLDTISPTPNYISIGATHASSLDNWGFIQTKPPMFPRPTFDAALFAQLKNRTHILRLAPGAPFALTVHGPDGKPVKAAVTVGAESGSVNGIPDLVTDDQGRLQLGLLTRNPFILAVHAPGLASAIAIITPDSPNTLDLTLAPPHPLRAHIVDASNAPIPNAIFAVDGWTDQKKLISARDFCVTLIADQHGDITWTEAPDRELNVLITAPGCVSKQLALAPGSATTITLFPQPLIRVHAVSANTGKPITDFRAVKGLSDLKGHDIEWLDQPEFLQQMRTFPDGTFEFTADNLNSRAALIARAVGSHYLPATSPVLPLDGHDYDVTLPLEEAPPLTGQALDADGKPLPHVIIALHTAWYDIYNANLIFTPDEIKGDPAHYTLTDNDGHFSFPPQSDDFLLVAATDNAYALAAKKKFDTDVTLTLHQYATLQGTVLRPDQSPAGNVPVSAQAFLTKNNNLGPAAHYSATTDAAGHFTFTHVFAGEYRLQVNPGFNQKGIAEKTFKVRSGHTATVTIEAPTKLP